MRKYILLIVIILAGAYTIKLTQELNGNLETQSSNEDEFFD